MTELLVWLLLAGVSSPFYHTEGWTGGDGAYSIPLGGRTLWLFGDTFIGRIRDGRREVDRMVHNTVALDSPRSFWFADRDFFTPAEPGSWYWPGHGALWRGKLNLFMKKVRSGAGPPGLDFDWYGDDLIVVDNPLDPPPDWRWTRRPLNLPGLHPGIAALVHRDRFYVFCLRGTGGEVALARFEADRFEFFDGAGWSDRPE
ncbi:MAG: hypothetical protein AB1758_24095, partial [Candidatus Eremiobacterota bacterium]